METSHQSLRFRRLHEGLDVRGPTNFYTPNGFNFPILPRPAAVQLIVIACKPPCAAKDLSVVLSAALYKL
jgi:hypothetical protein